MLCDLGGLILGATSGIVLSGGTGGTIQQIDGVSPYNTTVGIRFNVDGTIQTGKGQNGATAWSSAGSWITGGSADATYSVRFTNLVQTVGAGNWTTEAAADDTWIALFSAQRTWISNKASAGEREFTCNFEVRKTAGAPPTTGSAAYTFNIDNVL